MYDNMVGKNSILIPQTYDGNDMRNFTIVSLNISLFLICISKEFLTLSENW